MVGQSEHGYDKLRDNMVTISLKPMGIIKARIELRALS
jgi:hypothetical protein